MKIDRVLSGVIVFMMAALPCCMFQSCMLKANTKITDTESMNYDGLLDFMDRITADDLFSGVVLVAKSNRILFEKAYGMSDKNQNRFNNIDTKFNTGSIAKMFTAVAIAQLVEQGKLSFDDTIEKHTDGFPNEIARKITIKHLLTHTSGLGDIFTPAYMTHKDEVDTIAGFMPYIINQPLRFEPGEQHQYSNAGFIVLGNIIEKAANENYYDYIRKHIAEPLGMYDTDFYKKTDNIQNLARGYTNTNDSLPPLPPPDGQPRIIMLPPPAEGRNVVREDNLSSLPLIGNPSGGAPGISAIFRILIDEDYTVIIFSNYDNGVRKAYDEIIMRYVKVAQKLHI
jgi:CubicO group peptidase (beta-lactamase class C family)